jgi:hypothetical protein
MEEVGVYNTFLDLMCIGMLLMHVYSLARIETLLPLAKKKNNSMADASLKLCKKSKHPLSSNKSLTIENAYA